MSTKVKFNTQTNSQCLESTTKSNQSGSTPISEFVVEVISIKGSLQRTSNLENSPSPLRDNSPSPIFSHVTSKSHSPPSTDPKPDSVDDMISVLHSILDQCEDENKELSKEELALMEEKTKEIAEKVYSDDLKEFPTLALSDAETAVAKRKNPHLFPPYVFPRRFL